MPRPGGKTAPVSALTSGIGERGGGIERVKRGNHERIVV